MHALLPLTIVVPLASAAACLLARGDLRAQRALGVGGAFALLGVTIALLAAVLREGTLVVMAGGWPAPFGIALVADTLAAVLAAMAGLIGALGAAYALGSLDLRRQQAAFFPLLHLLLAGVGGALLTGDVFNLFVWFELMLVASFVLLALGSERAQLEGAVKYVLPSMIASVLLLSGVALLYRLTGTLNMADLAGQLPLVEDPARVTAAAMLILTALGLKAAAFPLFFWLPASYPTPPIAVTAIFSALLTKVAVYALLRLFTLLFVHDGGLTHGIILVVAGLTMVTGVLGAVAEQDLKRLLAYHIISQIGYMLMGLGLATALSLGATLYFVVHIMTTKTALFLAAGVLHRMQGTYDLSRLGGFYAARPALAAMFLAAALSLGGLPPFSGFLGKLSLLQAAFSAEGYAIAATALAVSLLTLFSMAKIWTLAFWAPPADGARFAPLGPWRAFTMLGPIGVLVALTLLLGLAGGPVWEVMAAAGEELADPSAYVEAVLGGTE